MLTVVNYDYCSVINKNVFVDPFHLRTRNSEKRIYYPANGCIQFGSKNQVTSKWQHFIYFLLMKNKTKKTSDLLEKMEIIQDIREHMERVKLNCP